MTSFLKLSAASNKNDWGCIAITLEPGGKRFAAFLDNNSHLEVETFKAIKGADLSTDEIVNKGLATKDLVSSPLLTKGAIGCAASHKAIWDAVSIGDIGYFVLEDDCYAHPNSTDFINANLALLMSIDICFFGINTDSILQSVAPSGLISVTTFRPKNPSEEWINKALLNTSAQGVSLHRLVKSFGTCAYFISPTGAKRLSEKLFPLSLETTNIPLITDRMPAFSIDRAGCREYSHLDAFICQPFLAYSSNTNSTTIA